MKRLLLPLAGLALACSRGPSVATTSAHQGDFQEGAVTAVITAALEGEAAGLATDTLYITDALVVVNGRITTGSPLLAGISQGGQVVITSSQLEIRPSSSWSAVDYRWEAPDGVTREGRATFVLAQMEPGRWRIQHLHSSSPQ
jgi:ketosteroid isomerase-like protein